MENRTPWLTVIVLYAFAAFLGGMVAVSYLALVGAIIGFDLSIESVTFADIAGPLISAVGIVVTALIARNGWVLQQEERRAKREAEIQQLRRAAKENRITLPDILDEISETCTAYASGFWKNMHQGSSHSSPYVRNIDLLPQLRWQEGLINRLREAAHFQEDPLLTGLVTLAQDMQIKRARAAELIWSMKDASPTTTAFYGKVWRMKFYKELFEITVIAAKSSALLKAARHLDDSPFTESVDPTEGLFDMAWRKTSIPHLQELADFIEQRTKRENGISLYSNN